MDNSKELSPEIAEKRAYEAVNEFIAGMEKDNINIGKIKEITELAFIKDEETAKRMIEPVFGVLVNDLKKSFTKKEGDIYLQIFPYFILAAKEKSHIVQKWFEKMHISSTSPIEDLYSRSLDLRKPKTLMSIEDKNKIKKAIILSRNTIGAEACINGIIINRAMANLPNAKIIFVDTTNSGRHIFNHPRISSISSFVNSEGKEISLLWDRHNISVLSRFEYTANLSDFIEIETSGLDEKEFIVFDADTRLSQTGAMPICAPDRHYFIDTVLKNDNEKVESLGRLCNDYLNRIFQESGMHYPKIFLPKEEIKKVKEFRKTIPSKKIIMLHFGSGLKSKSLSLEFEKKLALVACNYGTPIIILPPVDWEMEKIKSTISFLEENGKVKGKDFFTFGAPLSTFVSLINEMDLCICYDSQSQHMAASLGVPFITLFTGYINKTFLQRWTPISENFFKIIDIDKNQGNYEEYALNEAIKSLDEFSKPKI